MLHVLLSLKNSWTILLGSWTWTCTNLGCESNPPYTHVEVYIFFSILKTRQFALIIIMVPIFCCTWLPCLDSWFNLRISLYVVQVLKESFKIYCAINDGIINLVDKVTCSFHLIISCVRLSGWQCAVHWH